MRKLIYIINIFVFISLIFISCNSVFEDLTVNPNQRDVNNFYTTPENVNQGVLGIYAYITTPRAMGASGGRLLINRGDEGSDRSDYGAPGQYSTQLTPSWYTIVQPFQLFYTAIVQANQMIVSIPQVEFPRDELKNAYLGEAYFLRAFSHFYLLINFRNIPMIDTMPKTTKEYRPQATPEEVWDLIISDLQEAKKLLPKKGFWKNKNIGRVTSGSAAALLGKAYLYRSGIEKFYGNSSKFYYNEAAAAFDEIIRGKHGSYLLVDDYNDNFRVATENNDESLFELQFIGDVVNTGFNPGLPNSGLWRDPRGFYPPTTSYGATQVIHDWVYKTFVNSKDANGYTDSRMFGTLIFDDRAPEIKAKSGDKVKIFDGKTFTEYYGEKGFASVSEQAGKYKSACRKGIDWTLPTADPGTKFHMWNARAHGLNYTYIRYADVLLMYAESVFMGGANGSKTALEAINEVRKRSSVDLPPVTSIDMNIIENERILELTQEGHRFFDLLRWGKVAARFAELESIDPNFKQYNSSAYLGFTKGKNEWLPIPIDEVEGNPNINQNNPGW